MFFREKNTGFKKITHNLSGFICQHQQFKKLVKKISVIKKFFSRKNVECKRMENVALTEYGVDTCCSPLSVSLYPQYLTQTLRHCWHPTGCCLPIKALTGLVNLDLKYKTIEKVADAVYIYILIINF